MTSPTRKDNEVNNCQLSSQEFHFGTSQAWQKTAVRIFQQVYFSGNSQICVPYTTEETKGVGPSTTLAWPGWKQPDIPVEVDTARLETSRTDTVKELPDYPVPNVLNKFEGR